MSQSCAQTCCAPQTCCVQSVAKAKIVDRFPSSKIDQLIDEVRLNPCIWDKADPNYKNNTVRDKVWRKISDRLDVQKEHVKWKWAILRTTFGHHSKALPSGSAPDDKITWEYYESLSFLRATMETRSSDSNFTPALVGCINLDNGTIENADSELNQIQFTSSASTDVSRSSSSSSRMKRKSGEIDPLDSFLISKINATTASPSLNIEDAHFGQVVAETLAPFTRHQKTRIKAKVMQLLSDMYDELMTSSQ